MTCICFGRVPLNWKALSQSSTRMPIKTRALDRQECVRDERSEKTTQKQKQSTAAQMQALSVVIAVIIALALIYLTVYIYEYAFLRDDPL